MTAANFCREIEAYLCRKNDGHLIRIVGPAFEQVCGWAARGMPLAVACRGIDRTFERYYRKGARRRPVRIEFCEADVLDVFDDWRRAVGVGVIQPAGGQNGGDEGPQPHRESLPAHLDRVAARLTSMAAAERLAAPVAAAIDRALGAIEELRSRARALRGRARVDALDRLRALDRELLAAVRDASDSHLLAALGREAEQELAPFAERMAPDMYSRAVEACRNRLLRERLKLPELSLE
jgi:hypothetical protein